MPLYKGTQKICPIVKGEFTPTGTLSITANGVYDVTNYASADVSVSGGGTKYGMSLDSILGDTNASGVLQTPSVDANLVFSGVTDIAQEGLYYKFCYNSKIKSCSFPSLTTVSGNSAMTAAFQSCTSLTSADLSSLTTVSGSQAMNSAFYQCTGLTSIDLSSLTTVSSNSAMQSAFNSCTGLTGALDLSSLTTVSGSNAMLYVFRDCTSLTSADLSSLTTVSGSSGMNGAFHGCTSLTSVNFNNLQTIGVDSSNANYGQFSYCFRNCNNITSITFPKLEKIYCTGGTATNYGTFTNNNKVKKLYFPKLNTITYGTGASAANQNACKNVFYGCASLTELHFAAANQSAIEASPGYSTAWGRGAGNVTIYFDL